MKNIFKGEKKKKMAVSLSIRRHLNSLMNGQNCHNIFRQIYIKAIAEAHMKGERKRRKCEKPPGDGKELPARS